MCLIAATSWSDASVVHRLASRMKQPVDTVEHFFMLYKLATVGLFNSPLHACDEAGLVVEHAVNRLFHELFGILAIGRGYLLKPCFNIGRRAYRVCPLS